jgi:carbon starvation protein CstA
VVGCSGFTVWWFRNYIMQLAKESDAKTIGYGMMLAESLAL